MDVRQATLWFASGDGLPAFLPYPDAAFSPDGQYLASLDVNGVVQVWDKRAGQLLEKLDEGIACLVFHPISGRLFLANHVGRIRGYDLRSRSIFEDSVGPTNALAFSPDLKWLAYSNKPACSQCAVSGPTAESTSRPLAAAPATAGNKSERGPTNETIVYIWDVVAGKPLPALARYADSVVRVAFHGNGRLIALAGDNAVRVWEIDTGKLRIVLQHRGAVESVAFSPDGNTIASGCCDGTVSLWNLNTLWDKESDIPETKFHVPSRYLAYIPWNDRLVSGDQDTTRVWDPGTGDEILSLPGTAGGLAVAADGQSLASVGQEHALCIWSIAARRREPELVPLTVIGRPVTSPDGRLVAEATGAESVRLSEAGSGKQVCHSLAPARRWPSARTRHTS